MQEGNGKRISKPNSAIKIINWTINRKTGKVENMSDTNNNTETARYDAYIIGRVACKNDRKGYLENWIIANQRKLKNVSFWAMRLQQINDAEYMLMKGYEGFGGY